MNKQYRAVFQGLEPITDGKHPILLISVGKNYHEGARLLSAIELINRSHFKQCTIMVADSLQRHNYNNSLSEENARQLALELGKEWVARNLSTLNKLIIPYKIIHWENNYKDNIFCQDYREQLIKDYQTNLRTKDAIDSTINAYINRQKNNSEIDNEKLFQSGFKYVLEECPILMPLWAHQGYDFIIYPKKMTNAMRITYEKFVAEKYPEKVVWLPLRFRERKSY